MNAKHGDLEISAYDASDHSACLTLFESNVPEYFAPSERAEYEDFLRSLPGPYFVGRHGAKVVAAGGYAPRHKEIGLWILCWGMVMNGLHGQGLGRSMLEYRLDALRSTGGATQIAVNTSQKSAGFFQHLGFTCVNVVPEGYGPDLDLHEMRIKL